MKKLFSLQKTEAEQENGQMLQPEAVTASLLRIFSLPDLSQSITLIAVSPCILNELFLARKS